MRLRNREEAARLLAEKLSPYKGQRPLVLAIPRGAVPMGRIVADALEGELDVVLVRKIGAPGHPEFAIGAVDETGAVLKSDYIWELGISPAYVERETRKQLALLRRRREMYTQDRPPANPEGRVVMVVENGVATGATLLAALRLVRKHRPARLIAAMAVAPPRTLERVRQLADEVVCLDTPRYYAVSDFCEDSAQVSDKEVMAALKGAPALQVA